LAHGDVSVSYFPGSECVKTIVSCHGRVGSAS